MSNHWDDYYEELADQSRKNDRIPYTSCPMKQEWLEKEHKEKQCQSH